MRKLVGICVYLLLNHGKTAEGIGMKLETGVDYGLD